MVRRFSLCLVSVSIMSLLFVICLKAQEIRSQGALSPQEIFKRASPSVMVVESLDAKGLVTAFGSGVVIAAGRVVTNRHVIESGVSFMVERAGKTWPARLVKVDPDHDLAELSVDGFAAPAVHVRVSSTLTVGEKVYAIGAPEGLELTISEGLISGLRTIDKDRVIQTSAAISHGSSGGGLFDVEGRLVGVTTFFFKEGQSLNFALPGEWMLDLDRQPVTSVPSAHENSPAFQGLLWFEMGYRACETGKYGEAVRAYQEAIRLRPDFAMAWNNLGTAYGILGQSGKEVSAYQQAIRLKPDLALAWYNLGTTYSSLGQYGEAVSALQEALRLRPDFAEAWNNLGTAYGILGQSGKEVSAHQEALRLKPEDAIAWYNLGTAYGRLAQHGKAVSAFQEAIRLKPDYPEAWYNLGTTYGSLGQYGEEVSAYEEAIRLKPDYAEAWYNLGVVYTVEGQQSKVIKIYEKLKVLDPKRGDEFFRRMVLP